MDSTLSASTTILAMSGNLNSSSKPFISHLPRHFCETRPSRCLRGQLVSIQLRRLFNIEFQRSKTLSSISYSSDSVRSLCAVAMPSDGGEANSNSVVGGSVEVSALSPEVIILDVGGMMCGGCAASVKRILESQPHVASASVNLATETAMVWPASEARVIPNWQKQLGETLAKHLTACGFNSNLQGQGATEGDIPS